MKQHTRLLDLALTNQQPTPKVQQFLALWGILAVQLQQFRQVLIVVILVHQRCQLAEGFLPWPDLLVRRQPTSELIASQRPASAETFEDGLFQWVSQGS